MKKWNLVIDVARCHNCGNCVLANKDEHVDNDYPGYSAPQQAQGEAWIRIECVNRGKPPMVDAAYFPTLCNHCDNAPCVEAGMGAIRKRKDGIVIIDPIEAKGRKDLLKSCPYGAMYWNDVLEVPQIWTFDAHLLDQGWKEPRCTQVCPTGALQAVKISDTEMQSRLVSEGLEVLKAELNTLPRIYYRNLYRYTHCFIGGSVVGVASETSECLAGAKVTLSQNGMHLQQVLTDSFGDFKFDNLLPNSGSYELDINHDGYVQVTFDTELLNSVYLGVIELVPNGNVMNKAIVVVPTLEPCHA
ncbi:carboxypeptidase regulatory-like domain-containing protein [Vibrio fluvialis]|nr:carboxypeptidase regulatory-like domain-containing protein [Vibrio fluvialis]